MVSLKEVLSLLRVMHRYKEGFAYHKGRLDAKCGLPSVESEEDIAQRIYSRYAEVLQHYPEFPCEQDERDISDWLSQKQRRYLGYLAELRNLGEEIMCNKIAELYQADRHLRSRWCHFDECYKEAKTNLDEFDKAFPNYRSRVSLAPWVYYLLLILIGLAELPLNLVAFQLFGEAQVMALAVALALALVIPASAHWVGAVIKQPFRTPVDRGMLIATFIIIFLAILGIGLVREAYFRHMGEEVDRAITIVFIGIQLAMFVGGIIASYNAHDLRRDLQKRARELGVETRSLKQKREALRKEIRSSIDGYQAFLNRLRAAYLMGVREEGRQVNGLGNIQLEIPEEVFILDEDKPQLPEEAQATASRDAGPDARTGSGPPSSATASNSEVFNLLSKED